MDKFCGTCIDGPVAIIKLPDGSYKFYPFNAEAAAAFCENLLDFSQGATDDKEKS